MVNFDEIEFLESEIVDDDPTAPVGTLVHITEDGKAEPVEQKQDVQVVESDDQNETRQSEAKEVVEVGNSDNEQNEMAQTVTTDVQDEPKAEQTAQSEETVTETSQPEAVEQTKKVEETTDVSTEETLQVADESTETVETESVNEVADETAIETTEEPQEVAPQAEISEEAQNIEDASEETAPVEDNTAVENAPVEDKTAVENAVVEESAQESQNVEAAHDEQPEEQKTVQKAKKPRKPAQKKEAAPVVVNDEEHKTSLNLKNGKSVNDELFGTSFEMEQPAKAKIVSTKKKQEKAVDLWAVAAVANPKKETAPVKEEAKVEAKPVKTAAKKATTKTAESAPKAENEDVKPAPKKTASKKSTKVENINTSTEEKKVAKTTKEVATEEKPVKASKATKEVPVKEAPVKEEEKAHKAETKTVKDDETVIVEGEGKTHGKYVIKKTDKGNFVFKLYSSNYRVVAIGAQAYTTLGAAKIGIQSIINNAEKAPVENQTLKNYEVEKFPKWEIYQDKKGEYRLRLFATNGNLIATTNDGYADITGAKNGIAAVARANKGCAIVRNDNLW